jgi:conjugative relaxase-like TrwC/TraI family protein
VLSIGKLSAGQAKCYLDQREVRVDAVLSIGDGIEEYYTGGAEARGSWIESGGRSLDVEGPVGGEALRWVLEGLDPLDGSPLRSSSSAVKVAGFDLTFSAPKSVSVLFGIGDSQMRTAMRAGHDRAVLEAVGYLERSAAAVRRGHGGAEVLPAAGLVAAAFRHRTSRAGDPQMHTHVLVATSAAVSTTAGRRWTVVAFTRTREQRVSSTTPCCARSSREPLGSSGCRCATASPSSSGCPSRCCAASAAGARKSRRRWQNAGP